ncbi:hypothetical protein BDB00DRAFT_938186 [Zychaea mexicana]|uniref:uncharacterized protein n=1 Tax=Zychaea mexicana TaxID=64656 RepID=UPI0022FECD05|nr:uncharacterized protein BDB00DRAFT_938186 [Zychaea mexicana]KAI9494642.1 hypothetical protein BDB00DRAFT_938186 [Zychaea mexicana]
MTSSTDLDEFRNQWKQEVVQRAKKSVPLPADSPFATPPSSPPLKPTTTGAKELEEESSIVVAVDHSCTNSNDDDHRGPDTEAAVEQGAASPSLAIDMYRMAMDMERKGQLGQALLHYRRAFKLDPDVDRAYRKLEMLSTSLSSLSPFVAESVTRAATVAGGATPHHHLQQQQQQQQQYLYRQCDPLVAAATADGSDIRTLLGYPHHEYPLSTTLTRESVLSKEQGGPGTSSSSTSIVIDPLNALIREFSQQDLAYIPIVDYKPVAIAKLPDEMLVHVLGHLVLYSIATMPTFALVCKRFFLATRSASLWRHACEHMFRAPGMTLVQSRYYQAEFVNTLYDGYWLKMFIERPRLRYDGVYISVCQYIRPGTSESAWTQPVHLVTYYRYLRFFPDGSIVKYLSTDEPADVIRLLTPEFARRQVFHGRFCLDDDSGQVAVDMRDKTRPRDRFQMMLYIKGTSRGRHNKLGWLSYTSKKDGREDGTTYDLKLMRPYFFSVVRSYRKQV